MAIVYIHKRIDNGEVFYVGIGKTEKRAKSKDKRSKFWKDYVNLHNYEYEIVLDNILWKEACEKEIELISFYGRRDMKNGTLVNMTFGGEGGATTTGRKRPDLAERNKYSKNMTGISLRWINKDGKNKRVENENLQTFLNDGWLPGSLKTGPCEKRKGVPTWNKGIKGYKNPNISKKLKGVKKLKYKKRDILKCPHCEKLIDSTSAKRWHFDNCKNK